MIRIRDDHEESNLRRYGKLTHHRFGKVGFEVVVLDFVVPGVGHCWPCRTSRLPRVFPLSGPGS